MKEKEKEISSIDSLFWRIAIKDDEIAFRTLFFQFSLLYVFLPIDILTDGRLVKTLYRKLFSKYGKTERI